MRGHLGDAVAALVDGELDHAARERAQAHLAHCADCRREVDGQRRLKARLRAAPALPPVPPQLTERLLALGAVPPPGPARPEPARPEPARPGVTHPTPARPRGSRRPTGSRPAGSRSRRRAAVGSAMVVLGLGTALVLGGQEPGARPAPVDPASPAFVVDHAATTGEVPLLDPAAGVVTADLSR